MKPRIIFAIENSPIAVRIVPHNEDPTKVALKGKYPEAGIALAKLAGAEPEALIEGEHFFITVVDKAVFLAGLTSIVEKMFSLEDEDAPESEPEQLVGCTECGCSDGSHWQFCSKHGLN